MRRYLGSNTQHIREVVQGELRDKTRIAYLASDFVASSRQVYVQFSNPLFSRGSTGKANVAVGIDLSSLGIGTPVTVIVRRGQIQVVGIPLQSTLDAASSILAASERVYGSKSGTQSIANNTVVPVLFDVNDKITEDTFHSTTLDTNRFVAPWDGCYHVSGWNRYGTVSAAGRIMLIVRNSSAANIWGMRFDLVTTGTNTFISTSTDIDLVAGDWIEWAAFHVTGASQDLSAARASMVYLGA